MYLEDKIEEKMQDVKKHLTQRGITGSYIVIKVGDYFHVELQICMPNGQVETLRRIIYSMAMVESIIMGLEVAAIQVRVNTVRKVRVKKLKLKLLLI